MRARRNMFTEAHLTRNSCVLRACSARTPASVHRPKIAVLFYKRAIRDGIVTKYQIYIPHLGCHRSAF